MRLNTILWLGSLVGCGVRLVLHTVWLGWYSVVVLVHFVGCYCDYCGLRFVKHDVWCGLVRGGCLFVMAVCCGLVSLFVLHYLCCLFGGMVVGGVA